MLLTVSLSRARVSTPRLNIIPTVAAFIMLLITEHRSLVSVYGHCSVGGVSALALSTQYWPVVATAALSPLAQSNGLHTVSHWPHCLSLQASDTQSWLDYN